MGSLATELKRLNDELGTVQLGSSVDVRKRAAELVGTYFGADMCSGMSVREHEGKAYYCDVGMHSNHKQALAAWTRLIGVAPVGHGASWKDTLAARHQIGRFVGIEQLQYDLRSSPLFKHIYAPHGFQHQLRMLVMNGSHFAGWLGLLRCEDKPDWTLREKRALACIAPTLQSLMLYQSPQSLQVSPALPEILILCPDGKVEYAGPGAAQWLQTRRRSELASRVRRIDIDRGTSDVFVIDAVEIRLIRVSGDQQIRYTAMLTPLPVLNLGVRSLLSPQQLLVAQAAAQGATPADIGEQLGLRTETVRGYLKDVYRRLGVCSRVELAERMRD